MTTSGCSPGRAFSFAVTVPPTFDSFAFESRGVIQVKGKGEIETWLLQGEVRRMEVAV